MCELLENFERKSTHMTYKPPFCISLTKEVWAKWSRTIWPSSGPLKGIFMEVSSISVSGTSSNESLKLTAILWCTAHAIMIVQTFSGSTEWRQLNLCFSTSQTSPYATSGPCVDTINSVLIMHGWSHARENSCSHTQLPLNKAIFHSSVVNF